MDEPEEHSRRRMIIRRSRGSGFSSGVSTHTESLRESSQETDEVDSSIDPQEAIRRIQSGGMPPPSDRDNPRLRLNQVSMAGSSAYSKEYRLQLLHRMLMRNVPLDQIAVQLQVSISTVEKDRAELKKRLREAAQQLNIEEMVGSQTAEYDEIAAMALRIASQGAQRDENGNAVQAVPTAMRLAAMRTALAAKADKNRFYNTAGVYDVLRFRKSEDGNNISDIQQLMMTTLQLMDELNGIERDSPAPAAPSGRSGFAPLTLDDKDASGSSTEIQEI